MRFLLQLRLRRAIGVIRTRTQGEGAKQQEEYPETHAAMFERGNGKASAQTGDARKSNLKFYRRTDR
jgi:hypothetical protein